MLSEIYTTHVKKKTNRFQWHRPKKKFLIIVCTLTSFCEFRIYHKSIVKDINQLQKEIKEKIIDSSETKE